MCVDVNTLYTETLKTSMFARFENVKHIPVYVDSVFLHKTKRCRSVQNNPVLCNSLASWFSHSWCALFSKLCSL